MKNGLRLVPRVTDDYGMGIKPDRLLMVASVALSFLFLSACQTDGPTKAQYQSQAGELQAARDGLTTALDKLQVIQTENQTLKQENESLAKRFAELEAKDKALEEKSTKLEQLLNDLQVLQLNKLVDTKGLPVENLRITTTNTVATTEIAGAGTTDNVAAGVAHPAVAAAIPPVLNPAAPIAVATEPVVVPVLVTNRPSEVSAALAVKAEESGLASGRLITGFNRVERQNQRGTELFSERDPQTGIYYLYHRQAWYDQPGVFLEFSRPLDGKYRARLLLLLPDMAAGNQVSECSLKLAGVVLPVNEARIMKDDKICYQYAAVDYEGEFVPVLQEALDQGHLELMFVHNDGRTSQGLVPGPVMINALKDMMAAREDLR